MSQRRVFAVKNPFIEEDKQKDTQKQQVDPWLNSIQKVDSLLNIEIQQIPQTTNSNTINKQQTSSLNQNQVIQNLNSQQFNYQNNDIQEQTQEIKDANNQQFVNSQQQNSQNKIVQNQQNVNQVTQQNSFNYQQQLPQSNEQPNQKQQEQKEQQQIQNPQQQIPNSQKQPIQNQQRSIQSQNQTQQTIADSKISQSQTQPQKKFQYAWEEEFEKFNQEKKKYTKNPTPTTQQQQQQVQVVQQQNNQETSLNNITTNNLGSHTESQKVFQKQNQNVQNFNQQLEEQQYIEKEEANQINKNNNNQNNISLSSPTNNLLQNNNHNQNTFQTKNINQQKINNDYQQNNDSNQENDQRIKQFQQKQKQSQEQSSFNQNIHVQDTQELQNYSNNQQNQEKNQPTVTQQTEPQNEFVFTYEQFQNFDFNKNQPIQQEFQLSQQNQQIGQYQNENKQQIQNQHSSETQIESNNQTSDLPLQISDHQQQHLTRNNNNNNSLGDQRNVANINNNNNNQKQLSPKKPYQIFNPVVRNPVINRGNRNDQPVQVQQQQQIKSQTQNLPLQISQTTTQQENNIKNLFNNYGNNNNGIVIQGHQQNQQNQQNKIKPQQTQEILQTINLNNDENKNVFQQTGVQNFFDFNYLYGLTTLNINNPTQLQIINYYQFKKDQFPGPLKLSGNYSYPLQQYLYHQLTNSTNIGTRLIFLILSEFQQKQNINFFDAAHDQLKEQIINELELEIPRFDQKFVLNFKNEMNLVLECLNLEKANEKIGYDLLFFIELIFSDISLNQKQSNKITNFLSQKNFQTGLPLNFLATMKLEQESSPLQAEYIQLYPELYLLLILKLSCYVPSEITQKNFENFYYIIIESEKVHPALIYLVWIISGKLDQLAFKSVFKQKINKLYAQIAESYYYIYQLSNNFKADNNKFIYHFLFPSFLAQSLCYQEEQNFEVALNYLQIITENEKQMYSLLKNENFMNQLRENKKKIAIIFDIVKNNSINNQNRNNQPQKQIKIQQQQQQQQNQQNQQQHQQQQNNNNNENNGQKSNNLVSFFGQQFQKIKELVKEVKSNDQNSKNQGQPEEETQEATMYYDHQQKTWIINGKPSQTEPEKHTIKQVIDTSIEPPPLLMPRGSKNSIQSNDSISYQDSQNKEIITELGQQDSGFEEIIQPQLNQPMPMAFNNQQVHVKQNDTSQKQRLIKNRYVL